MAEKRSLATADIQSQAVLALPDRELMGLTIVVLAPVDVDADLSNLAQNAFQNAEINVVRVDGNTTNVNVNRNLSDIEVTVFCNQIVAVLAAQCLGTRPHA
jgi:hypothetical protein